MNSDPYDDLFVKEDESKEVIANTIKRFIKFTEGGEFIYQTDFKELSIGQKALIVFLASKVLKSRSVIPEEGYKIEKLTELIGAKKSSIKGQLYGKFKEYIKSDDGRIFIPSYKVNDAISKITEKT